MSSWSERVNWVEKQDVDAVCRAVLFKIAQRLDDADNDQMVITAAAMARFAKISPFRLTAHLVELETAGLLLRHQRRATSRGKYPGAAVPTLYLLNLRRLTPQQWADERVGTPGMLLPIDGKPSHETWGGTSESVSAQVSDQNTKRGVAADLRKRDGKPPHETWGGDLLKPSLPLHPPGGMAGGISGDDYQSAAAFVDDVMPWEVRPTADQRDMQIARAAAAFADGWDHMQLRNQVTLHLDGVNPDGIMVTRLHRVATGEIKPRRRPQGLPSARRDRDQLEARLQAVMACDLCDSDGYRGATVCEHDPEAVERNASWAKRLRDQLAARPATETSA